MSSKIQSLRIPATKAVILARVSTREQEVGYSIDAQTYRLEKYCQQRGLEILRTFQIAESSTQGDRRKFMEMIRFCKAQKQPIAIVADKVDRVQRSFKEYPLLNGLIEEGRIELHFNTENYVIHRDSMSQQRMAWTFGVMMAQGYVENLRDNVKRSIEHKIRNGEYVSRAPLGYLNVRNNANGKSEIVIDGLRAPLVRRVFEEFATGLYTLKHIAQEAKRWGLNTREGNPVSRPQIYKMLKNPFYFGMMQVKEKTYPHVYPPLIGKELFDRCAAVLAGWNKKKFRYGKMEFVFRGLLTCKANGKTVSSYTKSKTGRSGDLLEWTYLRSWDDSGKPYLIREEKLLAQVEEALAGIAIPQKTLEAITAYLCETNRAERSFTQRRTQELQKEADRLETRLSGLAELLIEKAITRPEYDKLRAKVQEQQIAIAQELEASRKADGSFKDALLALLDLCTTPAECFRRSTTAEKRRLLNFVFSNLTLDGISLCFNYRIPFSAYAEIAKNGKWRSLIDDLRNNPENRMEIIRLASQIAGLFEKREEDKQ